MFSPSVKWAGSVTCPLELWVEPVEGPWVFSTCLVCGEHAEGAGGGISPGSPAARGLGKAGSKGLTTRLGTQELPNRQTGKAVNGRFVGEVSRFSGGL